MTALEAVGLLRPARRRGFCPACSGWNPEPYERELAPPALLTAVGLLVAAGAWAALVVQSRSPVGMSGMSMGLGPLPSFAATWILMTAAMMLPSAAPLLFEFARGAERRRGWLPASVLLGLAYLAVWLAFGLATFLLYGALRMPWPHQALVGGIALAAAGLYGLSPLKRASEARCRELCALHSSLPFGLKRSAVIVGTRYGLSCIGCTGALMVALVAIGMSSLAWTGLVAAFVLIYKLGPAPGGTQRMALAAALVTLGSLIAVVG